jgi:ESS family glutamate:Na+ symporter
MERLIIPFDMTQTLFIAVLLLLLGNLMVKKVGFLSKYCIPGAVVGGLIFAVVNLIFRLTGVMDLEFTATLQQFFMNLFFTASGFAGSMVLLKKGGKLVLIFLALASTLSVLQNLLPLLMAPVVGIEPMIALMTGSTPLTGGHGNAGSFAPLAEAMGFQGATTVAMAAATFGLVTGSVMGGPIANRIITKKKLYSPDEVLSAEDLALSAPPPAHDFSPKTLAKAFHLILIGLGVGAVLFVLFQRLLPNVTLPIHVMGMLGGVLMRVSMDALKLEVPEAEIDSLGDICLGIFVSMAVFTMKLWELIDLAVPMLIILALQLVLIGLFVRFITFGLMGRNYDAAVICAGHIGFGLGAVPVSMANMNSVSQKFRYSKLAFFVVPIIGGLFSNFTNAAIITFFMNLAK